MGVHCTTMEKKKCHGLLLGLGIMWKVSILTLVLFINECILHCNYSCIFVPLQILILLMLLTLVKMPFKKKTLIPQCNNSQFVKGSRQLSSLFFFGFDAKNLGGTVIVFWYPALAVTESIEWLFQRENHHPRASWLNRANNKSHRSMRHTLNDRLFCLVTHIPLTPHLRWGLDAFLPLNRKKEGDWRDRGWNLLAMSQSKSGSL